MAQGKRPGAYGAYRNRIVPAIRMDTLSINPSDLGDHMPRFDRHANTGGNLAATSTQMLIFYTPFRRTVIRVNECISSWRPIAERGCLCVLGIRCQRSTRPHQISPLHNLRNHVASRMRPGPLQYMGRTYASSLQRLDPSSIHSTTRSTVSRQEVF